MEWLWVTSNEGRKRYSVERVGGAVAYSLV